MAVLGRLVVSSGERTDLPDLLSIDSYSAGDWQFFMKTLVGEDTPYIIKGFDIINPVQSIGTQSCSIDIADSAMYYPGSSAGSFFYGLPAGNPNAQPLVPELRKNATNYVYLTFSTENTSADTRAFWDPDANGGAGSEFTQEINTESVIIVQVNVSTGSFPDNTVPVAIVNVGPSVITSIEDARPMMFRLGSGGIAPNPNNRYAWRALPSAPYERLETPITLTSTSGQNPFEGGDKNIQSMKEWMDAVMTKLAELGGSQYWYADTSSYGLVSIFHDALATTFKSKGQYQYSSSNPGQLTYTDDILVLSTSDPRSYMIRGQSYGAGNGTIVVPNENVAYLPLVRNQPINALNQAVAWTNGQPYVNTPNGSIGFFANLLQGDWIKQQTDDPTLFLRVEQFYDSTNLGGSVTTPANAKSIRLSGNYQGATTNAIAAYDRGVYYTADIEIQPRTDNAITNTGGNFLWLVLRSDIIQGISAISSVTLSGTLTTATGSVATVTSTAHGLVNGDMITVTAPAAQAGTYSVDVIDVDTFSFNTSNTTTGAFTSFYGLLTTTTTNNGYGLQLESADHGFESGETIQIAGTTNYNGAYVINYRTSTEVQFALPASYASESTGTATLARMDVRTEEGITKIVQGSIIDIGEKDSANIQAYLGMPSLAATSPVYLVPTGYNTLNGQSNFNAGPGDNITLRAAKLTSMMADKAQDKTIKYLSTATVAVNTANGSAQELTFQASGATLTILQPGSPGNAVITLPNSSPGWSLQTNQSAYVTIDRNNATTPTVTIVDNSAVPVGESVIVVASRLGGQAVYLWNGLEVLGSSPLIPSGAALVKATYYDPVSTTLPTGNPVTEDGFSVNAGDLVLFSNLSSDNNQIYMANGTGTNITSWTAQYLFNGNLSPSAADTVIIEEGNSFKDQIGKFNDTTWVFNDKVRYFNGSDYWEQSNIITTSLADNTTNGTVFSVAALGSEYMVVEFSLNRSSARETGVLYITSDGTSVAVSAENSYLGSSGVAFSGVISGGNLILQYTTTATGSSAIMKLMIRRWSNASGGPGGVPSYSGTSTPAVAGGPAESIQYNNGGLLDGNSNFLIDTVNEALVLGGLQQTILSSGATILDNEAVPQTLFAYDASTFPFAVIEFSILRNGVYEVGRLMIANDTINTAQSYDFVNTASTGVVLSSVISGSQVLVQYTSTATGFNGTFKYFMRRWS